MSFFQFAYTNRNNQAERGQRKNKALLAFIARFDKERIEAEKGYANLSSSDRKTVDSNINFAHGFEFRDLLKAEFYNDPAFLYAIREELRDLRVKNYSTILKVTQAHLPEQYVPALCAPSSIAQDVVLIENFLRSDEELKTHYYAAADNERLAELLKKGVLAEMDSRVVIANG